MDYYDAMRLAISQAHLSDTHGDVPIGCVIYDSNGVVALGHNTKEQNQDPTEHAEMVAIRAAANKLGSWHLGGLTLAVTLEPCAMCAGAIVLSRISTVIYGASDPKAGALRSVLRIGDHPKLNHKVDIIEGIMETECSQLLTNFFASKRNQP